VCLIAFDLKSHVVTRPAIGPARLVLIPHTLPAHHCALASEHTAANRQTIHSSIVKEQGGSRRAKARARTRQKEVL
jgi:hypothetical protein